jgi:hypothetical protein
MEESVRGKKTLFVALLAAFMIVATAVVAVARSQASGNRVVDAPNTIELQSTGDDVRWILPGPRALDPAIFGTPGAEKGLDLLPIAKRADTPGGYFFSMDGVNPAPTPFSNNSAIITGEAEVKVKDVTALSGSSTKDKVNAKFTFTNPAGDEYKVVIKEALPEIPDHENFGGVGINALQHGATGIGTPLMPQLMAYVAFWGKADLYVNGELQNGVDENGNPVGMRFAHFMLSERVRSTDGDYTLAFDDQVDSDGTWQAHLILPNVGLTSDGPVTSPVPTGFTLPNGVEQPFMHIMFDSIKVDK